MSRALAKFRSRAMFTFVGGALVINPAFAQDAATATGQQPQSQSQPTQLDAVQVTGIRNSLSQAMDIKRDSAGVVDAISAEDIGKFPIPILPSRCSASPASPSSAVTARARR